MKTKNYNFQENEIIYKSEKEYKINEIIKGDTIEVLKTFPDNCIDVIFADPPYFMQSTTKENGTKKVLMRADGTGEFKGCNDEWDKYKDYQEYDEFCIAWLKECYRVLKEDGTIWVIGSFQNIYRIGYFMQNIGFWFLNDVIWNKTNPTPNMAGTRFCNAHETLLWCAKSKNSKFCFNYKTMKALNNDKQEKSVWTLGICQGNERLKDEQGIKLHTTQKPESLLEKVILSSTKPSNIDKNFIVLDPFFGTGTTGAICKKYGRNWVGIEKDDCEKYIDGATKRIEKVIPIENKYSNLSLETKPPKVSLKELLTSGLLKEEILYDKNGKVCCEIRNDGEVYIDNEKTTIHKLSAKLLNKNNNNGWTFFYVKRNETLVLIDELRYLYNKELKE